MNAVKKFVAAAKSYRTDEQMQKLQRVNFFSKRELREGLKRIIHLRYIECL